MKSVPEVTHTESWICTESSNWCDDAPTPKTCCLVCPKLEDCIRDNKACETVLYDYEEVKDPEDCELAELQK